MHVVYLLFLVVLKIKTNLKWLFVRLSVCLSVQKVIVQYTQESLQNQLLHYTVVVGEEASMPKVTDYPICHLIERAFQIVFAANQLLATAAVGCTI